MWAFILPELLKAIEAEPENEVLAELLASLARYYVCSEIFALAGSIHITVSQKLAAQVH